MPKPNHSIVSEEERIRYVDGTSCLTIWYEEKKTILAFELIFGLAVDEWAFRYHRSGVSRYCKVDDGDSRIGRTQTQVLSGAFSFPKERLLEFQKFEDHVPDHEKKFVLNILEAFYRVLGMVKKQFLKYRINKKSHKFEIDLLKHLHYWVY